MTASRLWAPALEDKAAYVTLTGDVSDELLKKTVEDEGYQVLEIL